MHVNQCQIIQIQMIFVGNR